jgi:glycosyltransferase involved in cell wall biosynthesis
MSSKNADNKLVVCELSYYAPTFYGNFMASLFDMELKLKERNADNKVIYAFYKHSKKCDWVNEMIRNNKSVFFITNQKLRGFLELSKIIKLYNVNILHLHYNVPVIILCLLKIFLPKIKIIAHFHNILSGIPGLGYKQILKIKIKKILYNKLVDIFCGCSEAAFFDLINCGINKNKCRYIDNGIVFSRMDNQCNNGRNIYKLENKKIIMILGSYFYGKGVDVAINAVKDIAQKYNIILMIICQNRDFVLEQIKKILMFVPEWIIIMPSMENVAFYFKMSDIYLTPSREEGFSYALLESIYCGTLTIRSNLPAMDRKLPNDLVVPVNDVQALRQSIEYALVLSDNAKQAILAEQKKYITERWNIDIWSKKIIDMYFEIVNN